MKSIELTSQLSDKAFAEMLFTSPRQVREVLFSRFHVKSDEGKAIISPVARRLARARILRERLGVVRSAKEDELCQELIRNWLYTKRPMLKAAMDFLNIANDNGLVDSDEDIFANVNESNVVELVGSLNQKFDNEEVQVYLKFMQVPHLDKVLQ